MALANQNTASMPASAAMKGKAWTLSRLMATRPVAIAVYVLIVGLIVYLAYDGSRAMGYNWQWYRVPRYFFRFTNDGFELGAIPIGLLGTLAITGASFVLALLLGLGVALLRLSSLVVGRAVAIGYLEIVRNIPLLVLLYLFYYVIGPIFGLDRFAASIACLGAFHAATISEIFRAGINAVPPGQWEASHSIGMTNGQIYRYIVLPQSVPFVLPPMTNEIVGLVKSSAIVSVIAVAELTTIGRNIISNTYMSFEIWFTIAAVYMVVCLIISIFTSVLEKRYALRD